MEGKVSRDLFGGDPCLLFSAAKVMTSLAFVQMNIFPWKLDVGMKITRLHSTIPHAGQGPNEKDQFVFPVSCIFACLDCLSDLSGGCELMGHLYAMITLIFTHLTALVQLEGVCPAKNHLMDVSESAFVPILMRCLKVHINSSGAPQDAMLLRLLFCVIRGINSFLVICKQGKQGTSRNLQSEMIERATTQNAGDSGNAEDDELWGSLDDSLLASIDLDCVGTFSQPDSFSARNSLWMIMTNVLEQSKVSLISTLTCYSSTFSTLFLSCSLQRGLRFSDQAVLLTTCK
jgi:hypothetical protein